jgi:hypothetical protein
MKKNYLKPLIGIQTIDTYCDIMDMSLAMFSDEKDKIVDSSEILVNKHSVWDDLDD